MVLKVARQCGPSRLPTVDTSPVPPGPSIRTCWLDGSSSCAKGVRRLSDGLSDAADGRRRAERPLMADAALIIRLVELADSLQRDDTADFAAAMLAMNAEAVSLVPGAQYCSITVLEDDDSIASLGPTHHHAETVDAVQRETGQGPCLAAARGGGVIRVDDLENESRWPGFGSAALARTPVRSVLSVHMFGSEIPPMAAMNFHAERRDAFTDESVEMAQILAAHATMAWNLQRREQQFSTALLSRDVIGQAKGMLMERFAVDAYEAFELLKRMSQESNVKLATVAEKIVTLTHPSARRGAD
ncbi:MAG: GAF and ANTAR domain-containing protein [Mycolicibacterium neoaurum]|uniref:GAF and ANTAR domain-containing protein n=1 Tax=Mycolicibacterium neoaurum TaxID=1795 RepID=UPI002FF84803